jgi:hypothetical protein
MASTPNYGWSTPDNTGLVKNGALDMRTLGNAIDTTTKALNPSTTLGDIEYRSSTANTNTRLAIGTSGQVLTVSGGVPAWATPAGGGGKVLQVVSATYSTSTNIVSTTYTDTGLSASITPTASTSKIMVIISLAFSNSSTTTGAKSGARILRGSTGIADFGGTFKGASLGSVSGGSSSTETIAIVGLNYLDSPATTSSTTYKVQAASDTTASGTNCTAQAFGAVSTITLMEIGA